MDERNHYDLGEPFDERLERRKRRMALLWRIVAGVLAIALIMLWVF